MEDVENGTITPGLNARRPGFLSSNRVGPGAGCPVSSSDDEQFASTLKTGWYGVSMAEIVCPMLVNAAAEGTACGDFALNELKIGDQVKIVEATSANAADPINRVAVWVRVTEISRHPLPDRALLTGMVTEVLSLGDSRLSEGQTIRFARCNVVQVA